MNTHDQGTGASGDSAELAHAGSILIPRKFFTKFRPSSKATLAYIAISYYTDAKARSCHGRSNKALGETVNASEATIKRGVAELRNKGAITVHTQSRESRAGNRIREPNLYKLVHLDAAGGGT
jgi:hypothetical protein